MLVGGKTHAADISAQNGLVAKNKQNNLTITAEGSQTVSTCQQRNCHVGQKSRPRNVTNNSFGMLSSWEKEKKK